MRNFYLSSAPAQTPLLVALFLTLILSLFVMLAAYGKLRDKRNNIMHLSIFVFVLIVLSGLADAFSKMTKGLAYRTWLPLPMWFLWGITLAADLLLIWDMAKLHRLGKQTLSRDSVKQALDMLPTGKWILCSARSHRVISRRLRNCRMRCQTATRAAGDPALSPEADLSFSRRQSLALQED